MALFKLAHISQEKHRHPETGAWITETKKRTPSVIVLLGKPLKPKKGEGGKDEAVYDLSDAQIQAAKDHGLTLIPA